MRESFPDRLGFFLADLRQWNSHATVDEDLNHPAATLPRSPSLRAQWRADHPYRRSRARWVRVLWTKEIRPGQRIHVSASGARSEADVHFSVFGRVAWHSHPDGRFQAF